MAASSIEDLLNFETHFESAAVTFLNDEISIDVFGTLSESELTTPRIEVQMEVTTSEFTSLREGGAAPTTKDFTDYEGIFTANVVTDNAVGQAGNHATYRAQCRKMLLYSGTNWDSSTLPYYDLKWLQPTESTYSTSDDFQVTALTWSVKFAIRDDAWPS